MADYSFGLVVDGVDLTDDDVVNRLVDEGVDDASFAVRDGSHIIYLDREGSDLIATVAAAVGQVERADPELRVVGLESQELLTQSGVAEVAGRTRQNIHQHVHGSRGSGFPAPVGWADGSRALWLAGDVSTWADEGAPFGTRLRCRQADRIGARIGGVAQGGRWPSSKSGGDRRGRLSAAHLPRAVPGLLA